MALKVKAVEKLALPKSFPSISQALSKHIASSNSHFEYANTMPTPCLHYANPHIITTWQSLNKSDCHIEWQLFFIFFVFYFFVCNYFTIFADIYWKY